MTTQTSDFLTVDYDPTLAQPVADAAQQYPVIQWNHAPGGWLLPVERVEEFDVTPPAGWDRRTVTLGSNKVECYFSPVAEVSILATTKRWFTTDENGKATYLTKYADGARSKTHALCIVKGSPDMFLLSAKGMTSADISSGLSKLQGAMKKINAVRPSYFFWTRIEAGDPQRLTKGATVTPAIVELPGKTDDVLQWLTGHFAGAEFVANVEGEHAEAIREFTKPRDNGNGDDPQPESVPAGPAPAPATSGAATTTTSAAPWDTFDAMPSATADRAVALTLAKTWKGNHEAAVQWALSLGAFADAKEAHEDYTFLWNRAKTEHGGALPSLDAWWATWIDAVLATVTDQVAVEEPGF